MTRHLRLLFFLVFASTFSSGSAAADNIAVVVDMSGSMSNYGSWQSDAKDAIHAILAGQPLSARWQSTPTGSDLSAYASGMQTRVTLLRFGNVRSNAEYPFFDGLQKLVTIADLDAQFPTQLSLYNESRTNIALAEAVAIRAIGDGSGAIRVIMVSDFLADAKPSEQQLTFINDSQSKYAKYTDATLSWAGNPRIQIKLFRFVPLTNPAAIKAVAADAGSLRFSAPRYDEHSQSVLLAWNYEGPAVPEKYDLKIADARHGSILFSKYNLGGNTATYPKAPPGPIRWSVTAYLQDGRTIEQSAAYNVPDTRRSPIGILILIIAVAGVFGALVMAIKKHGLPDFFDRFKRRSDSDL